MGGAITRNEVHAAISGFDIAVQVDCAICGSTDVSLVGAAEARETFEFVRDDRTDNRGCLATPALVVSCAECGVTYGLQS
jgi:hypothetical protein